MAFPMQDPVAQRVLDALVLRMKTIAPPAYYTDVQAVVLLEPGREVTVHVHPVISILPGTEVKADDKINCITTRQRFLIGATIRDGGSSESWRRAMRMLLGDIETAIQSDPQFGGLAHDTHVLDPTVMPRTGTQLIQGEIEIEIVFATAYHDISATA